MGKDVEDKRRYSLAVFELPKKCFAALHECGD